MTRVMLVYIHDTNCYKLGRCRLAYKRMGKTTRVFLSFINIVPLHFLLTLVAFVLPPTYLGRSLETRNKYTLAFIENCIESAENFSDCNDLTKNNIPLCRGNGHRQRGPGILLRGSSYQLYYLGLNLQRYR